MGLDAIIRSAVAIANSVTTDLQVDVTYEAFSSADDTDKPTYATAVTKKAVVEKKQRLVRTVTGQEKVCRAVVTFVVPFVINARDRITLPDGTTLPILEVQGVFDPTTDEPYMSQVFLG